MKAIYPSAEEFARAFYTEAVRHLEDAHVLHINHRRSASITSAMKAEELSVKAIYLLDNALGFYNKVFGTHTPISDLAEDKSEEGKLFNRISLLLQKHRTNILLEIKVLERLEPNLFGKRQYGADEANTEYPFLMKQNIDGFDVIRLHLPSVYFLEADSLKYYRLSYELLTVLAANYPVIAAWGIALPPAL